MEQLPVVAADVDRHVGERVRQRRMELGISQTALARALGLTFSQVQKYEKGANRIGAGRLFAIAKLLEVPVAYFYEDLEGDALRSVPNTKRRFSEGEATLLNAYHSIRDPQVRSRLIALARALAEERGDPSHAA